MKYLKQLAILITLIVPALLAGQNHTADIAKALTVFSSPQLQVNTEVNVYTSSASQEITQQYKAELKKDGDRFYSSMEGTRMLVNEKYVVMVYDADRQIICTERDRKSKKFTSAGDPSLQLDSLLKKNDSVVYKGIVDQAKVYTVYTGKSLIQRTEIHVDEKTGNLRSLVYYYNEKLVPVGGKVRVNYQINTAPVFSSNEFSEKRFVIFGCGDEVTAGSECPNYRITYIDPETATPTEK